jgi:hypothetical protein
VHSTCLAHLILLDVITICTNKIKWRYNGRSYPSLNWLTQQQIVVKTGFNVTRLKRCNPYRNSHVRSLQIMNH